MQTANAQCLLTAAPGDVTTSQLEVRPGPPAVLICLLYGQERVRRGSGGGQEGIRRGGREGLLRRLKGGREGLLGGLKGGREGAFTHVL